MGPGRDKEEREVLRRILLGVSRSPQLKRAVTTLPVSSDIVARFVAGETPEQAVLASEKLVSDGRYVSLDHLGEDTTDLAAATATATAYQELLKQLADAGLTRNAEVSVSCRRSVRHCPATARRSRWTTPGPSAAPPATPVRP
jgi:proline dehydrogenase